MLFLYDFECHDCGVVFEEMQEPKELVAMTCPNGHLNAFRIISGTRLDPKMGLTQDFPSMAAKWEKKTRARARNDKLTDNPNLWMY